MQSVLIPIQESCFLLRVLNGSFQVMESLKDQFAIYLTSFIGSKSSVGLIASRSTNSDHIERWETPNGGESSDAVFNALDAILKSSLDRLKSMRETIGVDEIHHRDDISAKNYWSDVTAIRALCLEGKVETALMLWKAMVEQRRVPDVVTHNYLLNAFCKSGNLGTAEKVVLEMIRHGPSPTCTTLNTLMTGYFRANEVDKALSIFANMRNHGLQPNRISCSIVVHGLCDMGLLENAVRLLENILAEADVGRSCDLITSTILMDSYFKSGNIAEALAHWTDISRHGMRDIVAYNVIIHGYCLSGDIYHAFKYLAEMLKSGHHPDIFTYNTLIGHLCKSGKLNEACHMYCVMQTMGIQPDNVTYQLLVQGLCMNVGPLSADHFLLLMLNNSFIPGPIIWNSVIHAFGEYGDLEKAISLKDQMLECGVRPNVYTYNILMHSQIKNGSIDKAHNLKKEMLLNGIFPDVVTYNLLIGAARSVLDLASALHIYGEMLRMRVEPDRITYTELLKCYCLKGHIREAEALLFKLHMSTLPIDHVPFIILMKKCFKLGKLEKLSDLYRLWLKIAT